MNKIKPDSWGCLTEEGNEFFEKLADEYIEIFNTKQSSPLITLKAYCIKACAFVNSEAGEEAEAHSKETVNPFIDFLMVLVNDYNVEEEEIIVLWQNVLYA
jgi:hypothetical protein